MCGEQVVGGDVSARNSGSSPRVRGTVPDKWSGLPGYRFIPACAGNSMCESVKNGLEPVHPRVCGEQSSGQEQFMTMAGSSPRVRGTVSGWTTIMTAFRFIPACAGNSPFMLWIKLFVSVHPRVCGEQICPMLRLPQWAGSSPRVRGTDQGQGDHFALGRFIPACAGNSPSGRQW